MHVHKSIIAIYSIIYTFASITQQITEPPCNTYLNAACIMDTVLKLTHPSLLYKELASSSQATFIGVSFIHIMFAFILLGICASDYLCPNVANIVEVRHRQLPLPSTHSQRSKPKISTSASSGTLIAILLSWCNSSPDLFSNLLSWTSSTSDSISTISLSVGEVLGACGIILCVVMGTILIIMSRININLTKSQKFNLLRDLVMVLIAMLFLSYIVLRNQITLLNCTLMIFLYFLYIYLKFAKRYHFHRHRTDSLTTNNSSTINNDITPVSTTTDMEQTNVFSEEEEREVEEAEEADDIQLRTGIKQSLISAMDFNSLLTMLENSSANDLQDSGQELISITEDGPLILDTSSFTFQPRRLSSEPINGIHTRNAGNNNNIYNNYSTFRDDIETPITEPPKSAPAQFQPYHDDPNTIDVEQSHESQQQLDQNIQSKISNENNKRTQFRQFFIEVLAPTLSNFKKKSKIDAGLSILTTPFVLLLQLSCPKLTELLEYDEHSTKYSLPFLRSSILWLQSLIVPLMAITSLSCLLSMTNFPIYMWIFIFTLSIGLLSLLIHLHRSIHSHNKFSLIQLGSTMEETENKNRKRRDLEKLQTIITIIFLAFGIVNSILFISLIANSLIELMELYQEMLGISKAILGLTIFAWGNSISDLLSNIAMCRLYLKVSNQDNVEIIATKFFVIAFQSCLGGVMLNSMIGIGLSGLIYMIFIHDDSSRWWFLRFIEFQEGDKISTHSINYKFVISSIAIIIQTVLIINLIVGMKLLKRSTNREIKFIGIAMCSLWGIATLCNICIELFT